VAEKFDTWWKAYRLDPPSADYDKVIRLMRHHLPTDRLDEPSKELAEFEFRYYLQTNKDQAKKAFKAITETPYDDAVYLQLALQRMMME
jgi:hypothetical protein